MVSFVLFDIGNVVVLADHAITHRILNEQYAVPMEKAKMFFKNKKGEENEAYREFSRGNITGHQFYEALRDKYIQWPQLTEAQAHHAHDEHLYAVDEKVVDLVRETAKHFTIGFLTDCNAWQTEQVEGKLIPLSTYSPIIFRSHDLHALKTDAACFPQIIKTLNLSPEEIVLVDNSPEKLEMAMKHGLVGIVYHEHATDRYARFKNDLDKLRENKKKNKL